MKKHYLLTVVCCLIAGFMRAATVSGAVYDMFSGLPIPNQTVSLSDTLHTTTLVTTTDAYGVYSFTLPASSATMPYMVVSTISNNHCGDTTQTVITLTGNSITANLLACTMGAYTMLNGEVLLSNGSVLNNGPAIVYVISKGYDPVLMDTTLTTVDSILTAPTGGLFARAYVMPLSSALLIKAVLLPSHPLYASYPPAYYAYRAYSNTWSTATLIPEQHMANNFRNDIQMTAGINPGGPGFIGGSVLLGANKGTAVGDPLSHRIVLLTTSTDQMVGYAYSDASGHFQFSNLPYGSYKLYGDAPGKTNPALMVNLSPSTATVTDIIFDENNKSFTGRFGLVGVPNTAGTLSGIRIYPNPVRDQVQIAGLSSTGGELDATLMDARGSVLSRNTISAGSNSIGTEQLPSGVYFLRLAGKEGRTTIRFVK